MLDRSDGLCYVHHRISGHKTAGNLPIGNEQVLLFTDQGGSVEAFYASPCGDYPPDQC